MKLASVLVASILGLGCYAQAQPAPMPMQPVYGPPGAVAIPAPVAVPAPVPVDRAERRALRSQFRQMVLATFDANHDGRLEPRERRQAARALRRMARRLSRDRR